MNVLSLFDGMSCGQQALERAGLQVDNYFASEIDKYAIKVTMANYPNTIQLGSVIDVDGYKLPKIDLLIGGSPCQSFSFAGKRKGMSTKDEQEILTLEHYLQLKSEGFEFEGQSYLFWEYMRLLNEVKPKYFLLENVMMGEKWEKILSKAIGVNPIMINSSLVSAQNRQRLYWTNIGMQPNGLFGDLESIIEQPKDKGILLKNILETEVDDKFFLSEKRIDTIQQSKRKVENLNFESEKHNCLIAGYSKIPTDGQYIVHNMMPRSSTSGKGGTGQLSRTDGKTYCLDTGSTNAIEIKDYGNKRLNENIKKHFNQLQHGMLLDSYNQQIHIDKSITINTRVKDSNCTHIFDCYNGRFRTDEKVGTITQHMSRDGMSNGFKLVTNSYIRRLTPIECERLQTVKDNYTNYVSDSQRYKMLGNGWTVDVIAHIFNYMKL
jgi:DNA-cytosine methyltransferase